MMQQKLLQEKTDFFDQQLKKEAKKLQKLREKYHHYSDQSDACFTSRFYSGNYPEEFEAMKARKDHICQRQQCKKKIPKGSFYFRRSFGRLWTIKACSIECFCWQLP